MACHILNLPEEILDPIVGALLPKHGQGGLLHSSVEYEHPTSLLCCRLVCRRLFRPASRWLCRHAHLKLYRQNGHIQVKGTPFTHPEYASNTRVLHVTGSAIFCAKGIPHLPPIRISPFFEMRNLQVLILQLSPLFTTELLAQLLSPPLLHTVVLEGPEMIDGISIVDSTDWSHIGGPFPNIKNVDLKRMHNIGPLISLSSSLEALSIRPSMRLDGILSSIKFPWRMLRQLSLENVLEFEKTCMALSESYENLKENTGENALLTEISVNQNLTNADAHLLLTVFSDQPLQSLLIGCVVNLDTLLLERVVLTFPLLQEFALLKTSTQSHLSTEELNHYATILGGLRGLRVLHMNCIRYHDRNPQSLHVQINRILVPLLTQCPKLVRLRLMHQGDRVSTNVFIRRNDKGECKESIWESCKDGCSLSTSAWRFNDPFM